MQDNVSLTNQDYGVSNSEILEFPASISQEAFYYLEKLRQETAPYNIAVRFRLTGIVDVQLLQKAFNAVIERQESLRTQFEERNGELIQIIIPSANISLEVINIDQFTLDLQNAELERLGLLEAQKSFDLQCAPLLRAMLVRLSDAEHILHVTIHHLVADGWSIGLLVEETVTFYNAFFHGETLSPEPLPIQYADFSVWQKDFLKGPEMKAQLEYWKKKLNGYSEIDIPMDHLRPSVKQWNGDILSELLPKELTDCLKDIAQKNGATLFHVFLSAFNILLYRYTSSTDIVIGTPMAGRHRAELEPLIGTFINSVIIRTTFSDKCSFFDILRQVRDTAYEAMENQDFPFESLVRELKPARDPGRNPLFQINFTHQRDFVKPAALGNAWLTALPSLSPGAIFDLHYFMVERDDIWRVSCEFSTALFERSTALRMLGHFRKLLESIAVSPEMQVGKLSMLTTEEHAQLDIWSGNNMSYPRDATIGDLFLQVANRHPDRPAIFQGDCTITYGQLHAHASKLVCALQKNGVKPGSRIAVSAQNSPERISALLAILMAGAAYIPLDSSHPIERTLHILRDAEVALVLSDLSSAKSLPEGSHKIIPLESFDAPQIPGAFDNFELNATNPACVIYKTGAVGDPKGVVMSHRALIHSACGSDLIQIGTEDVFLHAAPLVLDISTFEIWGALLNGASLVLPKTEIFNSADTAQMISRYNITTLWLPRKSFRTIVEQHFDALKSVKNFLTADCEKLPEVFENIVKLYPDLHIINCYGSKEGGIFAACHTVTMQDMKGDAAIPIGSPLSNNKLWILDKYGNEVPVGVPGNIFIGGDGLATEYLNDSSLTSERFIFNSLPGHPKERLFDTGDIARWKINGAIELIGRIDRQINRRGFHIDPAEVEAVISSYPSVEQCKVALITNAAGERKLTAWISPSPGAILDQSAINAYFISKLPSYLCPEVLITIDDFPLTSEGRIDLNALILGGDKEDSPSSPPQTEAEIKLAAIWRELLDISSICRDDDFFDIGGHSLLGLRLFSRIRKTFGITLPLAALLHASTLRKLAALISTDSTVLDKSGEESIIATVQPEGILSPFFCIHGGDGRAMIYRHLAEYLDSEQPLLGIESPYLFTSDAIKVESVEEIALEYLQELKKRQPNGPYCLGGYSFGGVVAYEMACILVENGEKVNFLALFDTMNPCRSFTYNPIERFGSFWRTLIAAGLPARIRGMFERAGKFWRSQEDKSLLRRLAGMVVQTGKFLRSRVENKDGVFAPRFAEAHTGLRGSQLVRACYWSMQKYRPRPYKGKLTLLKAAAEIKNTNLPIDYRWGGLVNDLEIVVVPGEHLTMFNPEIVEVLGKEVRRRLRISNARLSP